MEKQKANFNVADKTQIVDQAAVKESFINVLKSIHKLSHEDAEVIFEREAMYYKKLVYENTWLKESTGISLYSAFLEIAITGLSIQPGSKSEAYFEARSANQPENGRDKWVKVARLVVTAYGELNMRIKAGQIIRMNNPIVLYEGDHFQPKTNQRGELMVDYQPAIPRKSTKIFGVYCAIILPHNGIDFKWLLQDDIDRLTNYSIPKGKDKAKANALYSANEGQIDPGFLEAKCIKHAMRAYTKLKVSENIAFEDEEQTDTQSFSAPNNEPEPITVTQKTEEEDEEIF